MSLNTRQTLPSGGGGPPQPWITPGGPADYTGPSNPHPWSDAGLDRIMQQADVGSYNETIPSGETSIKIGWDSGTWPDLNYHRYWSRGDLTYLVNQAEGNSHRVLKTRSCLNLFSLNNLQWRCYQVLNQKVRPIYDQSRGAMSGLLSQIDMKQLASPAERRKLTAYLDRPEVEWDSLLSSDTKLYTNTEDGFQMLPSCTKHGMERYRLVGTCEIPPYTDPDPTELPDDTGRRAITVSVEGSIEAVNVWGINARPNAHCFVIRTRDREITKRGNVIFKQMADIPWANPHEKSLKGCPWMDYDDMSGKPQNAHATYYGRVRDVYKKPLSDARLRIAWGLDGVDLGQAQDACRTAGLLRMVIVPPNRKG